MAKLKLSKKIPLEIQKASGRWGNYKKQGDDDWQDYLMQPEERDETTSSLSVWRKLVYACIVITTFSLLGFRLVHLQIVQGKSNRELADSNRIQVKIIHAPRGVIYDRNGKILAQNDPGFRLVEASGSGVKTTYLNRDQDLQMEADNDPRLKDVETDSIRTYPFKEVTAHILGYVSEITEDELKEPEFNGYRLGDKIGRGGIEEAYQSTLRGVDGGEIVEVDAEGKEVRSLSKTDAIPGQNVYLSIDLDLQKLAYQQLEKQIKSVNSCCGALVAEDPRSGEIMAMVSYPSFDPSNVSQAILAANSPLLNRAIGGTYPPGSTFKVVTSLAGLNSGKITPTTSYEDTGVMSIGPYTFANWYFSEYGRKEVGPVDTVKALQRSNDIFFYQVGQAIGENTIADMAKKLGFGDKVGIDIPGEAPGLIPDDKWKLDNTGVVWYPGDTLHMAIGQGYVLTTPLQINNMMSIVAANGEEYPPHLALKITSPFNDPIKQFHFNPLNKKYFKDDYLKLVQKGLDEVPLTGGTAWPFFTFPIPTAGKTGTAEYGALQNVRGATFYATHAWYTSYAPAVNPTLAITVLVEGGGEGSTVSSPAAKEIYRWYLSPDKNNLIKDVTPIVATESAKTLGE